MSPRRTDPPTPAVLVVLDLAAKLVLLGLLVVVALDPAWGNLEGKAPTARAMTYPLLAVGVPVWWAVRRPASAYPWLADLLLTVTAFGDLLGNRLDLYDRVTWFDDVVHVGLTMSVSAALVLLTLEHDAPGLRVLERSVALGMTAALGWEVFECLSFVAHSAELPTGYADTVGDLALGWLGTLLAAAVVHTAWRHHLPVAGERPPLGVVAVAPADAS